MIKELSNSEDGKPVYAGCIRLHHGWNHIIADHWFIQLFKFTGDCPGFYLSKTIDDMLPVLNDYSFKIYNYNIPVQIEQ